MKRTFLRISLLVVLAACSSDDENKTVDLSLLTDSTQKTWYIYDETPAEEECLPTAAFKLDNSWIFFADGSFEYDHGELTEDPECQEDGCCSDLVNIIGSWESTNDGKDIKIMFDYEKDNPDNSENMVLIDGSIDLLTEDQLKISQVIDGTKETIEFRKK